MRVYCRLTGISQILNTYSSHKFNSYSEERPAIMEPSAFDPALVSDRLDWNLLRTFLTIVHERSISRAAVRLHITQPAVSLALRRLEDQLGHTLIERRGSRFRLTRAGEDVLRIATDVYGNVARLGSELGEPQDDVSGVLHLLTVSRIQSGVYDECLAAFHRHHPRVDLQVDVMRSADILDALAQKRAGIGLSLCRTPVEKLERQLFLRQRYAVFCGRHHRLFGRTGLSIDDLLGENFVSFMSDQLGDALSPLAVFRDQEGIHRSYRRHLAEPGRDQAAGVRRLRDRLLAGTHRGGRSRAAEAVALAAGGRGGGYRPVLAVAQGAAVDASGDGVSGALSALYGQVFVG